MHAHREITDGRCDTCRDWPEWWFDVALGQEKILDLLDEMGVQMTSINDQQAQINADVQAISDGEAKLQSLFLDAIAATKTANPDADLTALDAVAAKITGDVAADTAPATPVDPAPVVTDPVTPTPVDPAPVSTDPVVVDPTPADPDAAVTAPPADSWTEPAAAPAAE